MIDIWIKLFGLSCVVMVTYLLYFRKKEDRYNAAQEEKNKIFSSLRSELYDKDDVRTEEKLNEFDTELDTQKEKVKLRDKEIEAFKARLTEIYTKSATAGVEPRPDFEDFVKTLLALQKGTDTPTDEDLKVFSKLEVDNSLIESYLFDLKNNVSIIQHYEQTLSKQYRLENIPNAIRKFNKLPR